MQTAGYTHHQSIDNAPFAGAVIGEMELPATVGGVEFGRPVTLANRDEFGEIAVSESVIFTECGHALAVRDDPSVLFELEPDLDVPYVPDEFLL